MGVNAAKNNRPARKITVQAVGAFLFSVPLPVEIRRWRHLLPLGTDDQRVYANGERPGGSRPFNEEHKSIEGASDRHRQISNSICVPVTVQRRQPHNDRSLRQRKSATNRKPLKTVALTMETDRRLWYNIMKKFEERLFFKEYQLK